MNDKFAIYYIDARDLYVKEGKTLIEISTIIPVSAKTLGLWKNKEKMSWDEQRKNYVVQGLGGTRKIENMIFEKLEALNGQAVSDTDIKIIKELKSLLKEMKGGIDENSAVIIAMSKFTDFIKQKYPDKKDEFGKVITEFFMWEKK